MRKDRNITKILFEVILFTLFPILLGDIGVIILSIFFATKILSGRKEWLFKSLFYLFLFRFLNPVLYDSGVSLLLASWGLLLLVFFITLFKKNKVSHGKLKYLFIFILSALISSIFKSEYPVISLFKLVSFFIGFYSLYIALGFLNKYELLRFLFIVWFVLLIFSLPTILIPSIGFERNLTGFQGITNQPNFYGPFNALFGGTLLILNIFLKFVNLKRIINIFLISINFYVVILSESRTALLLLLLCSILIIFSLTKLKSNNRIYLFIGLMAVSIFITSSNSISSSAINFLAKDRTNSTSSLSVEKLTNSRAALTAVSILNFMENPMLGIGFAAPNSYYEFDIKYLGNTNIPISATIEKGNLYSQTLEETGLFGFIFFLIFITDFIIKTYKTNPTLIVFILAPLILNFGEATFFSTNGQGLFLWTFFLIPMLFSKNEIKNILLKNTNPVKLNI